VIPHRRGDEDRGRELLEPIEVRAHHPPGSANLVADDAFLLGEEPAALRSVAGRIEVVEGVEEAHEIARFARRELGPCDAELLHARRHARQVIPHHGGDIVERTRLDTPGEIGSDLGAHTVDRVTLGAALGAEDSRTRQRVLAGTEGGLGRRRAEGNQRQCDDHGQPHRSDHGRSFLSERNSPIVGRIPPDGRRCYSNRCAITITTRTSASTRQRAGLIGIFLLRIIRAED